MKAIRGTIICLTLLVFSLTSGFASETVFHPYQSREASLDPSPIIDVPVFTFGTTWSYFTEFWMSYPENGDYFHIYFNTTVSLGSIESIFIDENEHIVYNFSISGSAHGDQRVEGEPFLMDGSDLDEYSYTSPDSKKEAIVDGYLYYRISDLSLLEEYLGLTGFSHQALDNGTWWTLPTTIEYKVTNPIPVEELDFPIIEGDRFWFEQNQQRLFNFWADGKYTKEDDFLFPYNYTITCDGIENITSPYFGNVSALRFSYENFIDGSNITKYYLPQAGTYIIDEITDLPSSNEGGLLDLNKVLTDYSVGMSKNKVELVNRFSLPGGPVFVTGFLPNNGNENIKVGFPITNQMQETNTDEFGFFSIQLMAPEDSDVTGTSIDVGSFGLVVYPKDSIGTSEIELAATTLIVISHDPQDPIAEAGANIDIDENTWVEFNGSGSRDDLGIINYTWTLFDYLNPQENPNTEPINLYGPTPSYTFRTPGHFEVTLEVFDIGFNYASDTLWVNVTDTQPPEADAGFDIITNEDVSVILNANRTTDNDPEIFFRGFFEWTFEEMGEMVVLYGVTLTYTFQFPRDTPYEVTLTVTDSGLNQANDTLTVLVLDNTPPVADAGGDQVVEILEQVFFDGYGSYDPDDRRIVNYTWELTRDSVTTFLYGENPSYIFNRIGIYTLNLTVRDRVNLTGYESVRITVVDTIAPVAQVGEDLIVNEDTLVELDGSASWDRNPEFPSKGYFNWTIDLNGETILLYGMYASYSFTHPGIYNITLKVTDPAGNFDVSSIQLQVNDITPPVAIAGDTQIVEPYSTVTFNGLNSYDPENGTIDSYEWSFDVNERSIFLEGASVEYSFDEVGRYQVTLSVVDSRGENSATDSMYVRVGTPILLKNIKKEYDGATVSLQDQGKTLGKGTVSNGEVEIPVSDILEDGQYKMKIVKKGYKDKSFDVDITRGQEGSVLVTPVNGQIPSPEQEKAFDIFIDQKGRPTLFLIILIVIIIVAITVSIILVRKRRTSRSASETDLASEPEPGLLAGPEPRGEEAPKKENMKAKRTNKVHTEVSALSTVPHLKDHPILDIIQVSQLTLNTKEALFRTQDELGNVEKALDEAYTAIEDEELNNAKTMDDIRRTLREFTTLEEALDKAYSVLVDQELTSIESKKKKPASVTDTGDSQDVKGLDDPTTGTQGPKAEPDEGSQKVIKRDNVEMQKDRIMPKHNTDIDE